METQVCPWFRLMFSQTRIPSPQQHQQCRLSTLSISAIHSWLFLKIQNCCIRGSKRDLSSGPICAPVSHEFFGLLFDLADTIQLHTQSCGCKLQKFNHPQSTLSVSNQPSLLSPSDPSFSTAAFGEQQFHTQLPCCPHVWVTHWYNPPQLLFLHRKESQPFQSLFKPSALSSCIISLFFSIS